MALHTIEEADLRGGNPELLCRGVVRLSEVYNRNRGQIEAHPPCARGFRGALVNLQLIELSVVISWCPFPGTAGFSQGLKQLGHYSKGGGRHPRYEDLPQQSAAASAAE